MENPLADAWALLELHYFHYCSVRNAEFVDGGDVAYYVGVGGVENEIGDVVGDVSEEENDDDAVCDGEYSDC